MTEIEKNIDFMFKSDKFSQWLGIQLEHVGKGTATLNMKMREEMANGFGIIHGGIIFSLADSALAFASNGAGNISVALNVQMSFLAQVRVEDVITATATEIKDGRNIGTYNIDLENQEGRKVGHFTGSVFRTGKALNPES